jgi:hypothetical protein
VRQYFAPWTHRNALRDLQISPDTKTQVCRNVPDAIFVESVPVPLEHEK